MIVISNNYNNGRLSSVLAEAAGEELQAWLGRPERREPPEGLRSITL